MRSKIFSQKKAKFCLEITIVPTKQPDIYLRSQKEKEKTKKGLAKIRQAKLSKTVLHILTSAIVIK